MLSQYQKLSSGVQIFRPVQYQQLIMFKLLEKSYKIVPNKEHHDLFAKLMSTKPVITKRTYHFYNQIFESYPVYYQAEALDLEISADALVSSVASHVPRLVTEQQQSLVLLQHIVKFLTGQDLSLMSLKQRMPGKPALTAFFDNIPTIRDC